MTVDDGVNPPVTTNYLLDGQNVIREIVGENVTATYLNGYRGIEYREAANGEKAWYLYDGLGCVIAEMEDDGTVYGTRTYKPFGAVQSATGNGVSNHKFCGSLGHTADASCGLTYMRARYYDPVIGRFISEDPAGNGTNWFAYCNNNPVNRVDQTGKASALIGLSEMVVGGFLIKLGEYLVEREGWAEVAGYGLELGGTFLGVAGGIGLVVELSKALGHILDKYTSQMTTMIWSNLERNSQQRAANLTDRVSSIIEGYESHLMGYLLQAEAGQ